jgi:kinetochore protein Spc7/SPC105
MQELAAEKESRIVNLLEQKAGCLEDIKGAEKIREECRGWSLQEVKALKGRSLCHQVSRSEPMADPHTAKVDVLENKYGWTITTCDGNAPTMSFHREIELTFDMGSFLPNRRSKALKARNSPVDVVYIGDLSEHNPSPYSVEKQFFIQRIKMHLQGLRQGQVHVKDLLTSVGTSWCQARAVTEEIRLLNHVCFTEAMVTSERGLSVKSTLILGRLATKIHVVFDIAMSADNASAAVEVQPTASVAYGERFNEGKMGEYLAARIGEKVTGDGMEKEAKGSWARAVKSLRDRLVAQGKSSQWEDGN